MKSKCSLYVMQVKGVGSAPDIKKKSEKVQGMVSIIIPCYNYAWLLPETLDSVLAQTYLAWECIIIDDGSTDNTQDVSVAYLQRDIRFRYVHQDNAGMSAARNHGLKLAQGEYIQFLDADDLLAPRKLEMQVAYLMHHSAYDLVCTDVRYFEHGAPSVLGRSMSMSDQAEAAIYNLPSPQLIDKLIAHNVIVMNSPLLRLSFIESIGGFAENLRSMEDWEFWIRCAMNKARFGYLDSPLAWALVRVHPTSTSRNVPRMAQYEILARQQLMPLLKQIGASSAAKINEEAIINQEANLATNSLLSGSIVAGVRRYLRLAYRTGRYMYYLKSIPYWLNVRKKQ